MVVKCYIIFSPLHITVQLQSKSESLQKVYGKCYPCFIIILNHKTLIVSIPDFDLWPRCAKIWPHLCFYFPNHSAPQCKMARLQDLLLNICLYEYITFLLDYMKEQVTKLFVQITKWPTNLKVLSSIVATVRWGKSNYCLISPSSIVGRFNMGCASADGDAEYCLASLFYISTSHLFIVIISITPTCLAHNTLVLFVGDL